jgi:hypothetical protein
VESGAAVEGGVRESGMSTRILGVDAWVGGEVEAMLGGTSHVLRIRREACT